MQSCPPLPDSYAETVNLVAKTVNDHTQMLAIYIIISLVLGTVLAYFLYRLIEVVVRYKRRVTATRKTDEARAMARPGSVSLLSNANADDEIYEKNQEPIAETMDDYKEYTENIQRALLASQAMDIESDKTAVFKQFDEYGQ